MNTFKFAPHFTEEEFTCRCGCGTLTVNQGFLERLERARVRAEVPFSVISGGRCPTHNAAEGGVDRSAHEATELKESCACDIAARGSRSRFIILKSLLDAGFTRIGIAETFIHVDEDVTKPPMVVWLY